MNLKLELVKSYLLPDFPSGSSINFYDGKLYLIGDDANQILILEKNYQKVGSILLFSTPDKRIPKSEKADLETSTLVTIDGDNYLLALGSASREIRKKLILIPLDNAGVEIKSFQLREFCSRLNAKGVRELNIEGSAQIGNQLILANRGNQVNQINHLIITECNFWRRQQEVSISVYELSTANVSDSFLGVSEIFYVQSNDLLLFTFSTELTKNAYDDGAIGDSYVGWIEAISNTIKKPKWVLDGLINLSDVNNEFKGEKIEGICMEGTEFLHLISDNDQGQSKLFRVKLTL